MDKFTVYGGNNLVIYIFIAKTWTERKSIVLFPWWSYFTFNLNFLFGIIMNNCVKNVWKQNIVAGENSVKY